MVWPKGASAIHSVDLLDLLLKLPESPWKEYEWTDRKMAKALKNYEIKPGPVWLNNKNRNGYLRADLEGPWER